MGKNIMACNDCEKGGKKLLFIILGIIITLLLLVVIIVSVNVGKNVKAMNGCVDAALAELRKNYTVTPLDVGDLRICPFCPQIICT